MRIKGIIDEDFINYKKPSMTIMFPHCDFKCDKECGQPVCQNSPLIKEPDIEISECKIIERYLNNPISEAIVFQGLEPFDSLTDVMNLIIYFRQFYKCNDDIVIYTGYTKEEIQKDNPSILYIFKQRYGNIVIKYGRYVPGQKPHYDRVLGVQLASDNQYAERL